MENVKRIDKSEKTLICERNQGDWKGKVLCSGCKGFYSKRRIKRHKKQFCSRSANISPKTIYFKKIPTTSVDPKFQEDILNHFREDDIGMICVKDQTIIRFGVSLWLKNSKKMERKGVMAEMRRLGKILMKMRSLANDETLKGENIFERDHFPSLKEAIIALTTYDNGEMKYGERISMGYTLIKGQKVQLGHMVVVKDEKGEKEVERFGRCLNLHWGELFHTAELKTYEARNNLRKPSDLPLEEDTKELRSYILGLNLFICSTKQCLHTFTITISHFSTMNNDNVEHNKLKAYKRLLPFIQ